MQSALFTSSKKKHHETEQTVWSPGRTDIFLDDEISPQLPIFDPQPAVY